MKKYYRMSLLMLLLSFSATAQKETPPLNMDLQPYRMAGQTILKRNLSFDTYKTQGIHRTLGSYLWLGNFPIGVVSEGVPLHQRTRDRLKDVFRFELEKNDSVISTTECRAIMRKDETFSIFRKQDSSFFGVRNVDLLEARIQLGQDTSNVWQVVASNLNGTKDEDQKGIARKGDLEIQFIKRVLLLREKPVDRNNMESLMATANIVYSFTYNNEIVAAVSFKETDRKIWFKDKLEEPIKTIIASTACMLTLRRDLYR